MKLAEVPEEPVSVGSRPARALWIEILLRHGGCFHYLVEAREGLVD